MRPLCFYLSFIAVLLFGPVSGFAPTYALAQTGAMAQAELSPLCIITGSGAHSYQVELAETLDEKARGLMFRTSLPHNQGMLFVYEPPRRTAMWMKNTFIPLDILFIESSGRVAKVHSGAKPHDLSSIDSQKPVGFVLELLHGQARLMDIREGHMVYHATIGSRLMPHECHND